MTSTFPITENKLKGAAPLAERKAWLLIPIAFGLYVIIGNTGFARTAAIWIVGFTLLPFLLSIGVKEILRKSGQQHSDRRVKDARTYLELQPAQPQTSCR